MSSAKLSDWSLIAIPGLIWGASFLFIAEGLEAVGPMGVTLIRVAVGFAALACFHAAWKPIERRDWPAIVWLAVLWMAFPLSMFPFAEQRISSALAGMLNGAVPLSAAIIASIIARRLPSRGVLVGLAVGLVGVVLMSVPDLGAPSSAAGVLMVTIACVSYGFAPNLARPLQQKYGSLPVIWRAQAIALLILLPLGARDVAAFEWKLFPVLSLLALGALGTGVAHVVMATASGKLGATKASASAFLIPPVALLLGVVVRSEHVAWLAIAGGALCVAGAWIMRRANAEHVQLRSLDSTHAEPTAPPATGLPEAARVDRGRGVGIADVPLRQDLRDVRAAAGEAHAGTAGGLAQGRAGQSGTHGA